MINFYSTHCGKCCALENYMKENDIEFNLIDDSEIVYKTASKYNILSMPFAEIDGEVYDSNKLTEYLTGGNR